MTDMCATRKNKVEYTTKDGVVSCQDFDNIADAYDLVNIVIILTEASCTNITSVRFIDKDKNIVFSKEFNEKE